MKSAFAALWITALLSLGSFTARSQYMEKVTFDAADSTNGYYLAIPPSSNKIMGTLVFFASFRPPESILPETRLHNVAADNNLLTIYASMGTRLTADPTAITRMNTILQHVVSKYKVDTSAFVLGGFDMAGTTALRFTEWAYQHPSQTAACPKAVFGVSSYVDLFGFYQVSERQIKKNAFPPAVSDARFFLDEMTKELGKITDHPDNYKDATPFYKQDEAPGNERFLRHTAVRLYYDTDIPWQINTRRNSLYDTNIPDGSELINRLLLAGNKAAELIASRQPGMRSNGIRHATALSIVDETDCIQWITKTLHILNPANPMAWKAPYTFIIPDGWRMERSFLPGPFSPHMTIRGIEDLRFPPGWDDAKSSEYWSVAYLLWLDGGQKIDAEVLQTNLRIYYDDLIAGALVRRDLKIPTEKIPPVKVSVKKIRTATDDIATYAGTIDSFDYLGQHPITLNVMAHVKACNDQRHIPLFWEISPQPFDHPLWRDLTKPKEKFNCEGI